MRLQSTGHTALQQAGPSRSADVVVFSVVRASVCAECGEAIQAGRFLRMEAERPHCLSCADLAHLVFVERGNAALTRRATRYSSLHAVVLRFSRARKRYERQGVLVDEDALSARNTSASRTPMRANQLASGQPCAARRWTRGSLRPSHNGSPSCFPAVRERRSTRSPSMRARSILAA